MKLELLTTYIKEQRYGSISQNELVLEYDSNDSGRIVYIRMILRPSDDAQRIADELIEIISRGNSQPSEN